MLTASLQDRILLAKGVPQITIMHELCPSCACHVNSDSNRQYITRLVLHASVKQLHDIHK